MADMRFLTIEAMFLRGVEVGVSPLLLEFLEVVENMAEDFLLRRPRGFLSSSSAGTCTECRIGATSPSLSDLESSLNRAGSRLTFCARLRLLGTPSVSGDVSKASARSRSGIRMVAVLLGEVVRFTGSRGRISQLGGGMNSGEEGVPESRD